MLLEREDRRGSAGQVLSEDHRIPAALTDTGCERELNEDRYAVIEGASGLAWLVCDGMGGVTGGELAAQLAIDAIRRDLENLPERPPSVALRASILEANRIIVLRRQNQAFAGMGTTLVAALFHGREVAITHVGDSRAYLLRDGAIQQLTTDHTLVQELVERGEVTQEEALSHPQGHVLTRCVGAEPGLELEVQRFWMWQTPEGEPRDTLLLCSDGLYSLIADGELAQIVSTETPQRACARLVELAKARGGFDNITIAIIPLEGQLRNEPPLGYRPPAGVRAAIGQKSRSLSSGGVLRLAVLVGVLSVLAFVLTVFVNLIGLILG